MDKLKVAFDDPLHGYVFLTLAYGAENELLIRASHIFDCFLNLTNALLGVWDEQGERTVTLLEEPDECVLRFIKTGPNVALEIRRYPGHLRDSAQAEHLLSISGTYNEVCLPFWRALRALQGRFTAEEFLARWKESFPTRELNLLTETIKRPQVVAQPSRRIHRD